MVQASQPVTVKVRAVSPGATVGSGDVDSGAGADEDSAGVVGAAELDVDSVDSVAEAEVDGAASGAVLVQALSDQAVAARTMTKRFTVFLT